MPEIFHDDGAGDVAPRLLGSRGSAGNISSGSGSGSDAGCVVSYLPSQEGRFLAAAADAADDAAADADAADDAAAAACGRHSLELNGNIQAQQHVAAGQGSKHGVLNTIKRPPPPGSMKFDFGSAIPGGESGDLRVGKPLSWDETTPHLEYVREHALKQFVCRYRQTEGFRNDELKWGDELEYAILKMDDTNKRVRVSMRADAVIKELQMREYEHLDRSEGCNWTPEYGSWMLEGTPKRPLEGLTTSLAKVERNMRLRRNRILESLREDEIAPTMVNFPLFGVGDFTHPPSIPGGPIGKSEYVSDATIQPRARFLAFASNIRDRRGRNVIYRSRAT